MVIFAIVRNRSGTMMTFTNMFLMNLSLMDLLRILVCLPNSLVMDVAQNWYLGTIICKIVAFIEAFEMFVSELTLSYIAYDRWQCLQNPFKSSNSTSIQKPKIIITIIWMLAAVLALPEPFMSNVIPSLERPHSPRNQSTEMYTTCARDWSRETDALYVIVKVIFSFCCPLIFMIVIYAKVIQHIWKHSALTPSYFFYGSTSRGRFNEPLPVRNLNRQWMHRYRRRKQTIKMLIAMTVVYNIGYFPLYIVTIVKLFVVFHDEKLGRTIKMMSHWFCYSTAAITPFIYGIMSVRFREEFTYMCKSPTSYCCFCKSKENTKQAEQTESHIADFEERIDKPLISSIEEKTVEEGPELMKEHKDLISMPSTLSHATHRTLSPMTSDTSTSTNRTRSTNLSSDTDRLCTRDNSHDIPEEEINEENLRFMQDIGESNYDYDTSTIRETNLVSYRCKIDESLHDSSKRYDIHASEIVKAIVHHSYVDDVVIVSESWLIAPFLRPSTSMQNLQTTNEIVKDDTKEFKSCPILSDVT